MLTARVVLALPRGVLLLPAAVQAGVRDPPLKVWIIGVSGLFFYYRLGLKQETLAAHESERRTPGSVKIPWDSPPRLPQVIDKTSRPRTALGTVPGFFTDPPVSGHSAMLAPMTPLGGDGPRPPRQGPQQLFRPSRTRAQGFRHPRLKPWGKGAVRGSPGMGDTRDHARKPAPSGAAGLPVTC